VHTKQSRRVLVSAVNLYRPTKEFLYISKNNISWRTSFMNVQGGTSIIFGKD